MIGGNGDGGGGVVVSAKSIAAAHRVLHSMLISSDEGELKTAYIA